MTLNHLISALLFILPCILVLCLAFSDHFKMPNYATVVISIAAFMAIDITSTYIYYTKPLTIWMMAFLSFSAMLIATVLFQVASGYNFTQSLFIVAIVLCYTYSIYTLSSQLHYAITGRLPYSATTLHTVTTLIIAAVTFPLMLILFKKLLRPALDSTESLAFWRIFWGIPVCNTLLYTLTIFPTFADNLSEPGSDIYLSPILWIILTFSIYVIVLRMIVETIQNARLETALHISETQLAAQQKQTEMLQQRIEETARMRHDFRHTLIALQAYLLKKDYDGMEEFISSYISSLNDLRPTIYCDDPIANAIVSYYAERARDSDISFTTSIHLAQNLPFSDTDACIILGNLLENALEACQRQSDGARYIHLKLHDIHESALIIMVENSYNGTVLKKNNAFLSTKAKGRKGIGIASVLDIVSKYNGIPRFEYDKDTFKVSILLNYQNTD